MRKLEEIRKDVEDVVGRLLIAKASYADIVIEYMDMGHDSNHHIPKAYQKVVVGLSKELNELYDEYHEAFYS